MTGGALVKARQVAVERTVYNHFAWENPFAQRTENNIPGYRDEGIEPLTRKV